MMIVDSSHRVVAFNRAMERATGWFAGQALGRECWDVCGDDKGRTLPLRQVRLSCANGLMGHMLIVAGEPSITHARGLLAPDIIAAVSHELLSPLNLIGGYATTMLHMGAEIDADQSMGYLEGIRSATARAVGLVRDFLDAYRFESNLVVLNREPVELVGLVSGVVAEMQLQTSRHDIHVRASDDLPPVSVDRLKLERVLHNLVGNAIKYSPSGGDIEVTLESVPAGGEHDGDDCTTSVSTPSLIVSVKDNGIGIPENHLGKVFAKFYRVESDDAGKLPGVGLGLFICRLIVEAHGGRIWARSSPGRGSVFSFSLPVT